MAFGRAFSRLNAGKTPLTSSELIRFSVVADVDPDKARQDPLLLYRTFEDDVLRGECRASALRRLWEETLRCWWWMQSCHADVEAFHLMGWLSLFTNWKTRVLFREEWKGAAGCRMESFKAQLRKLVAGRVGEEDLVSFRYGKCDSESLRRLFVLLNMLEAEQRHARFRFDLFRKRSWDVEHIASQTDNPLSDKTDQEEWLRLGVAEMTPSEKRRLDECKTFAEKWNWVWSEFDCPDGVSDKDEIGNLALLDSSTNRSYGNAIFPAKRRRILLEAKRDGTYIPPCTEAAFEKAYSPSAPKTQRLKKWNSGNGFQTDVPLRLQTAFGSLSWQKSRRTQMRIGVGESSSTCWTPRRGCPSRTLSGRCWPGSSSSLGN